MSSVGDVGRYWNWTFAGPKSARKKSRRCYAAGTKRLCAFSLHMLGVHAVESRMWLLVTWSCRTNTLLSTADCFPFFFLFARKAVILVRILLFCEKVNVL